MIKYIFISFVFILLFNQSVYSIESNEFGTKINVEILNAQIDKSLDQLVLDAQCKEVNCIGIGVKDIEKRLSLAQSAYDKGYLTAVPKSNIFKAINGLVVQGIVKSYDMTSDKDIYVEFYDFYLKALPQLVGDYFMASEYPPDKIYQYYVSDWKVKDPNYLCYLISESHFKKDVEIFSPPIDQCVTMYTDYQNKKLYFVDETNLVFAIGDYFYKMKSAFSLKEIKTIFDGTITIKKGSTSPISRPVF